jgi:hypothetical protein
MSSVEVDPTGVVFNTPFKESRYSRRENVNQFAIFYQTSKQA